MGIMKRDKFNGLVAEARELGIKSRDILQTLLIDAMHQFLEHEDTSRLNKVMELCREVKTWPTKAIHSYITDHCDVRWKKKTEVYAKEGEGHVTFPTVPWWEYKNSQDVSMFDLDKQLKSLITKAVKAKKEGKLKGDESGHGHSKIEALAKLQGVELGENWYKPANEGKEQDEAKAS